MQNNCEPALATYPPTFIRLLCLFNCDKCEESWKLEGAIVLRADWSGDSIRHTPTITKSTDPLNDLNGYWTNMSNNSVLKIEKKEMYCALIGSGN